MSHIGGRDCQQDSFAVLRGGREVVVADGMGGHFHGEKASSLVVDKYCQQREWLIGVDDAIKVANWALKNHKLFKGDDPDNILQNAATTISVLSIEKGTARVFHAGDSPVYLQREGELSLLASPHITFMRDFSPWFSMVNACGGNLGEEVRGLEDARAPYDFAMLLDLFNLQAGIRRSKGMGRFAGAVTSCLKGEDFNLSVFEIDTRPGDGFLVCSDGIALPPGRIREILSDSSMNGEQKVDTLIDESVVKFGADNATAVLVTV
ncbi:hypothetical protein A2276_07770 [candidate division WOR-1 bacterium RIFOXYA12_FULL_43_27]|uniref:PPM-type phosphatase domain-containing protein n=1 Tax=candidate division WOR-1 bacterium RIFOXYC2_FULL_46_14 TaxID=1802587 RepID=A0A1F4U696_UNCSA|nr:MAG: hypothetical protein A2276_07770 [candidate division WOR-1 bacterium RIFOXYA12_FULL_43_27]OGC20496.1 MAG: hypothetical protein A2292_05595 [candidate division WOR-1 bacterium RIFOXYB2_FULL_46_45]OGC31767.1 MAG: hypothetical protein A2232_05855 [candidate division WOR-1 bacterium RIFOXYA2_FULL_46_56]OGC40340.1 MAG: hypothetical protein A2438_03615 [candidate division WOR-1 bacterium RIFOXYC2_FULL_46_14]